MPAPRASTSPARPLTTVGRNLYVVPAFNEEENIPRLLAELEARPDLFTPEGRLVIVDDGSSDGTCAVVESYAGWLPLELLAMGRNRGPGAAFRAGFRRVLEGAGPDDLVITLEADTTSDLGALAQMCELARDGSDLVLASVHGGGSIENASPIRVLLSRAAGVVVRRSLGVDAMTVSSFFRVYRAPALVAGFERYGAGFMSEAGFACKAQVLEQLGQMGAHVSEVPVDLDASRRIGESKMRILPTLVGYARVIAAARLGRGKVSR